MKAADLLSKIEVVRTNLTGEERFICGTYDSRRVSEKYLFFDFNGGKYVDDAIKSGAAAIVCEEYSENFPCICVKSARRAFCQYLSEFYGNPEKSLKFIAVTGTNGKTSTVKIIDHILSCSGFKTANIGTLGACIDGVTYSTGMTTPDSDVFFKLLDEAKRRKVDYVILELSAHAIYYKKLDNIVFDYCVFTNATEDHLDFFGTMENYISVKKRVFTTDNVGTAVINVDDKTGFEIISERQGRTLSYGLKNPADVFAVNVKTDTGISCVINAADKLVSVVTPLSGEFNLYNLLAAVSVCADIGVSVGKISSALSVMPVIDGRFNVLYGKTTVIIDYAHTPDGLKSVLIAARKITPKKLYVVFGCGGDRDRQKRPVMGEIAATLSDFSIITSDNPRSENPEKIIDEIVLGLEKIGKNYITVSDRYEAIKFAVDIAGQGDTVLIAGKGAEEYMETAAGVIPFSDKKICEELLGRSK